MLNPPTNKCPICGKTFEPTGKWVYKKSGVLFCTWRCLRTLENYTPRKITYNGETKSLMQWAKESGIPYSTLYKRITSGDKDPFRENENRVN